MEKQQWGTIAAIIYFSLYALLLLFIAIHVHITEKSPNKKTFFKYMWNKRGIYGQILVHLYDTATDIGVLVQWYILAQQEKSGPEGNIESLDMNGLFWISVSFLILYRVISVITATCSAYGAGSKCSHFVVDVSLAVIDMYIIKAVYQAIKGDAKEPTLRQKMIQLSEAIFESLPQVVLQSVFIIRWHNNAHSDIDTATMSLVGMSLLASLFSIANKYSWIDKESCAEDEYKDAEWSKKSPIVNKYYVLRIVWRYAYIITRFAMISLVWSVVGGAFLAIFLPSSWFLWYFVLNLLICLEDADVDWQTVLVFIPYAMVCLVATPAFNSKLLAFVHGFEVFITMSIITWFAFDPSMDCGMCADRHTRQAMNNPYILSFIITGWIAMIIDFITYALCLMVPVFSKDDFTALLNMFEEGLEPDATTN
eukprot:44065_1